MALGCQDQTQTLRFPRRGKWTFRRADPKKLAVKSTQHAEACLDYAEFCWVNGITDSGRAEDCEAHCHRTAGLMSARLRPHFLWPAREMRGIWSTCDGQAAARLQCIMCWVCGPHVIVTCSVATAALLGCTCPCSIRGNSRTRSQLMIHEQHQRRIAGLCSTEHQQQRRHVVSDVDGQYMYEALTAHMGKSNQCCLC